MGIYLANGTRVTKSGLSTSTESDPLKVIGTDLYKRERFTDNDNSVNGKKLTLLCKAGSVLRQSQIDLLFPAATATAISPSTVGTDGGDEVTITGTNFDGVTSVTFSGTAGTDLVIDSPTQLRVKVPAKTAGAKDVVIVDDSGSITKTGFVTYA